MQQLVHHVPMEMFDYGVRIILPLMKALFKFVIAVHGMQYAITIPIATLVKQHVFSWDTLEQLVSDLNVIIHTFIILFIFSFKI